MGFDGVRETDDTGTDNDEVRGRCGLLVGHDADSNVIAVPFLDVLPHLSRQVHLGFTCALTPITLL